MKRKQNRRNASMHLESLEGRQMMSAGDLDPTFGSGGTARTGFLSKDVAVDAIGRTIVVGSLNSNVAVKRLNANGLPDATFGTNGLVVTDLFGRKTDQGERVVIQPDGRIVVAAMEVDSGGADKPLNGWFRIARYNANGSLDRTFGVNGLVRALGFQTTHGITGLGLQPGGKIVFSATLVGSNGDGNFITLRLTPNGLLDTTFGDVNGSKLKGYVVTDMGGDDLTTAQFIQRDGKIVIGGTLRTSGNGTGKLLLARYHFSGQLDRTFSGDGKLATTMIRGATLNAIAVDPLNRIVVAGSMLTGVGVGSQMLLRRVNPNGLNDSTFNNGTSVLAKASPISQSSRAESVFVRANKIVVVGDETSVQSGVREGVFAAQFDANGKLDFSFGSGGLRKFNLGNPAFRSGAALAQDGKIAFAFGALSGTHRVARFDQALPGVAISAIPSTVVEGQTQSILVQRDGGYDFPTRVYINFRGNAIYGKDYVTGFNVPSSTSTTGALAAGGTSVGGSPLLGPPDQGFIEIPAFKTSVTVPVTAIADNIAEGSEQADFILFDNPLYQRHPTSHIVAMHIRDNPLPPISGGLIAQPTDRLFSQMLI